jgi:hypothetical protein
VNSGSLRHCPTLGGPLQTQGQQPSQVHRRHAMAEPQVIAFDAPVRDAPTSMADQLGEAAFHHGPPVCVGALKCFGFRSLRMPAT